MIDGHRISKKLKNSDFIELLSNFSENNFHTTKHTFFRLKEREREVFKQKIIKEILLSEIPILDDNSLPVINLLIKIKSNIFF